MEIYPHIDPLIYISSNPKMFVESYSALRLDEEDSSGYKNVLENRAAPIKSELIGAKAPSYDF